MHVNNEKLYSITHKIWFEAVRLNNYFFLSFLFFIFRRFLFKYEFFVLILSMSTRCMYQCLNFIQKKLNVGYVPYYNNVCFSRFSGLFFFHIILRNICIQFIFSWAPYCLVIMQNILRNEKNSFYGLVIHNDTKFQFRIFEV